jgi:hypothetical protein
VDVTENEVAASPVGLAVKPTVAVVCPVTVAVPIVGDSGAAAATGVMPTSPSIDSHTTRTTTRRFTLTTLIADLDHSFPGVARRQPFREDHPTAVT